MSAQQYVDEQAHIRDADNAVTTQIATYHTCTVILAQQVVNDEDCCKLFQYTTK